MVHSGSVTSSYTGMANPQWLSTSQSREGGVEPVGIPRRGNLPGSPVEITAETSQLVLNFVGCSGSETLS